MKNIIATITFVFVLTACGGADFTTGISNVEDSGGGGKSLQSTGGAPNSSSGGVSNANGGNPVQAAGGALGGNSGAGNGGLTSAGGSDNLAGSNTGGIGPQGTGGTTNCSPKTCGDVALELGGDMACGIISDDGCGHALQCGDDCVKLPYSNTYSKCGASYNTTWSNGSPIWKTNPNLCGLNCFEIDNRFSNGNVGPCESKDGTPINPNIPFEVHCKGDSIGNLPLPRPGCTAMGGIGVVDYVFCCAPL